MASLSLKQTLAASALAFTLALAGGIANGAEKLGSYPVDAKKVSISKEATTIVDGAGEKSEIQGRVAQIKAQVEDFNLKSGFPLEDTARDHGEPPAL